VEFGLKTIAFRAGESGPARRRSAGRRRWSRRRCRAVVARLALHRVCEVAKREGRGIAEGGVGATAFKAAPLAAPSMALGRRSNSSGCLWSTCQTRSKPKPHGRVARPGSGQDPLAPS